MAGMATAQDRLANFLNAKHVSHTNSGHAIRMEQPQLVIHSIREVVDAERDPTSWRRSKTRPALSGKNRFAVFLSHNDAMRTGPAMMVQRRHFVITGGCDPLENLIRCGFASLLCGDRLAAAPEPRVSVAKCNHLTGMSLMATNEM